MHDKFLGLTNASRARDDSVHVPAALRHQVLIFHQLIWVSADGGISRWRHELMADIG